MAIQIISVCSHFNNILIQKKLNYCAHSNIFYETIIQIICKGADREAGRETNSSLKFNGVYVNFM